MIRSSLRLLAGAALLAAACQTAPPPEPITLLGAACMTPPPQHCPETACPGALTSAPGNVIDERASDKRAWYLDYPCDLKPGEKVTFVLNLHGGGSIANWQRHYFPIMDFKEKYRLVIATPYGPNGIWQGPRDDQHLRNIVEDVENAVGKNNIQAFWLAGHSFGGQTSNRLINTDPFFQERVDGWVSLSGGRLGSKREDIRAPIPRGTPPPPAATPPAGGAATPAPGALAADASVLPAKPFSFIYEAGEHEYTAAGVPRTSPWAEKLGCGAQAAPHEVSDAKAGYVFDGRPQENRNKVWGLDPRGGTAKIWVYPGCANGRVVADISRLDKGHTEGLEPNVTEEIIKLMLSAKS
jgi:pimeloyl-ACP methyl ester carboxylesterase